MLGLSRRISCIFCLVICVSTSAASEERDFGLAVNKLEHLLETDVSVFEIEATFGGEDSFVGIKSESEFDSGRYSASENQLYYARSMSDRVTGLVGLRYLDFPEGGDSSAMLGATAELPIDVEILVLAFFSGEYTEGRVELERPTQLSPRIELQPKLELRAFSREFESVAAELRLAYATTDRMQTYVGVSWSQTIGAANDQNEVTALVGLSYEW